MKRSRFKGLVAAGLVAGGIGVSTTTAIASSDMFLKVTNIVGETTDAKHKGEMDVLAWSWGTSTGEAKTKKVVPAACVQDLSLTKYVDRASPALIVMGITGDVANEAVLTVRRTAGAEQSLDYLTLRLTNVSVSAYSTGGSGGEDRLTENIVLHFDSMRGEYRPPTGQSIFFDVSGNTCR